MIIAGLAFKQVTSLLDGGHPTVFLYKHLASGKLFPSHCTKPRKAVAASKSLPKTFKDFLIADPSEYQLWACEIPNADTIDLKRQVSRVSDYLYARDKLVYRSYIRNIGGTSSMPMEKKVYHICTAVQQKSGAHYVFVVNENSCPGDTFNAKLKTHNGYVQRQIPHANRTMHAFAKKHKPLDAGSWMIDKDAAEYDNEDMANRIAIKVSKDLMLAGKVVLNRVSGSDPLYYHNQVLRLPNLSVERYIAQ